MKVIAIGSTANWRQQRRTVGNNEITRSRRDRRLQFHIIYVSVNGIKAGLRARTKEAIGAIRHVFIEADEDGPQVIAKVAGRADLPPPSYLIHSSPNRVHVLWRAAGFSITAIERLQKHLASELGTDPAATPCSQTTRLPGYVNHKYSPGHLVNAEYGVTDVLQGRRPFRHRLHRRRLAGNWCLGRIRWTPSSVRGATSRRSNPRWLASTVICTHFRSVVGLHEGST